MEMMRVKEELMQARVDNFDLTQKFKQLKLNTDEANSKTNEGKS